MDYIHFDFLVFFWVYRWIYMELPHNPLKLKHNPLKLKLVAEINPQNIPRLSLWTGFAINQPGYRPMTVSSSKPPVSHHY